MMPGTLEGKSNVCFFFVVVFFACDTIAYFFNRPYRPVVHAEFPCLVTLYNFISTRHACRCGSDVKECFNLTGSDFEKTDKTPNGN